MPKLSEEQIRFIELDLKKRGIKNSSLLTDLTDHICCAIEERSEEVFSEKIYVDVISSFGENGILEIERETKKLINQTKQPTMKKTMIYSGIGASLFILSGSIFKIFHWPGAGALFILGSAFLSILFFPSMFFVRFKEKTDQTKSAFLSFTGALSATCVTLGMLFKIMHWPFATVLWICGISLLMFIYLPLYFVSHYKKSENKLNAIITMVMIVCGSGIFIIAFTYRSSAIVMEKNFLASKELMIENKVLMNVNESKIQLLSADSSISSNKKQQLADIVKYEKEINTLVAQLQTEIVLNDLEKEGNENFNLLSSDWEKRLNRNDLGDIAQLSEKPEMNNLLQELNLKLKWMNENVISNYNEPINFNLKTSDFEGNTKNITLSKLSNIERGIHLRVAYSKN